MKIKLCLFILSLLNVSVNAKNFTNSIGIEFVTIPSGIYEMGTAKQNVEICPKDDPFTSIDEYKRCLNVQAINLSRNETPIHQVRINSFYLATTEITQLQYYKIMGKNPSAFKKEQLEYDSRNNPIENVNWYDIKKFIQKLNEKEKTTKYYLPSEEEWEYAARANNSSSWCFGYDENELDKYSWYASNSNSKTHKVAQKEPNKWGLYDMYGNVWEWTNSWYTKRYNSSEEHEYKVLRGGSYFDCAYNTRSAVRFYSYQNLKNYYNGFRIAKKNK